MTLDARIGTLTQLTRKAKGKTSSRQWACGGPTATDPPSPTTTVLLPSVPLKVHTAEMSVLMYETLRGLAALWVSDFFFLTREGYRSCDVWKIGACFEYLGTMGWEEKDILMVKMVLSCGTSFKVKEPPTP